MFCSNSNHCAESQLRQLKSWVTVRVRDDKKENIKVEEEQEEVEDEEVEGRRSRRR